jgi:hypothetical protein
LAFFVISMSLLILFYVYNSTGTLPRCTYSTIFREKSVRFSCQVLTLGVALAFTCAVHAQTQFASPSQTQQKWQYTLIDKIKIILGVKSVEITCPAGYIMKVGKGCFIIKDSDSTAGRCPGNTECSQSPPPPPPPPPPTRTNEFSTQWE